MAPPAPSLDPRKGLAMAAAGMVVISPDALLIRLLEVAGTWELAFYRSLFLGLGLTLFLGLRYGRRLPDRFRVLGRGGLVVSLFFAATSIGFAGALTQTTAANALFIIATVPVFGAVFGWLILRERVALRTVAAIALAFGGIAIIFGGALGGGGMLGIAIALGTAACLGMNLVLRRRIDREITLPALCLAGYIAAAASLPFADPAQVSAQDVGIMAYIGLIMLPIALSLFYGGARYAPAAEVGLIALVETVLGPFWVWLGVGETPTVETLIGGTLVLAAVGGNAALAILAQRRRQRDAGEAARA